MPETSASSDRWPPIRFLQHAVLAIICFFVSAAAFVSSVFLYTYCIPVISGVRRPDASFPTWWQRTASFAAAASS